MDKVRFGRALGYGARHAAKSLLAAADAAAAPSPAPEPSSQAPTSPASRLAQAALRSTSQPGSVEPGAAKRIVHGIGQARAVQQQAGKQVRRSFLAPLAKFSSVVSLQVTGTFFALLALIMGQAAWRSRSALHMGWAAAEARRVYLVSAVGLLFAYFAISNYIRARRRDRRL